MVNKNIQMKKRNGASWDNLLPITTAINVIHADGKTSESKIKDTVEYMETMNVISPKKINFIGHRGASTEFPENSVPAFELCGSRRASFWGIETDIRQTLDGHWVCMHDSTIDRTTSGTGQVSSLTLAQIRSFDLKRVGMLVPTFDEYLDVCLKLDKVPIIELKSDGNLKVVMDKVIGRGLEAKAVIISGTPNLLNTIRTMSRKIRVHYLVNNIDQTQIDIVKSFGNSVISTNKAGLTQEHIALAHSQGLEVSVWTVNDATEVYKYIQFGVDYITTDKGAGRFLLDEKVITLRKAGTAPMTCIDVYSSEDATLTWNQTDLNTKVQFEVPFPAMSQRGASATLSINSSSRDAGYTFATKSETETGFQLKTYKDGVPINPMESGDHSFWVTAVLTTY